MGVNACRLHLARAQRTPSLGCAAVGSQKGLKVVDRLNNKLQILDDWRSLSGGIFGVAQLDAKDFLSSTCS